MNRELNARISGALASLGSTADLVAAKLEKLGIKGMDGPSHCPLACYLMDVLSHGDTRGRQLQVYVYSRHVSVDEIGKDGSHTTVADVAFIGADHPMSHFTDRYDAGDFPFLRQKD